MKIVRMLVGMVALVALAACVAAPPLWTSNISRLNGPMLQSQVLFVMGAPTAKETLPNGKERWVYKQDVHHSADVVNNHGLAYRTKQEYHWAAEVMFQNGVLIQ